MCVVSIVDVCVWGEDVFCGAVMCVYVHGRLLLCFKLATWAHRQMLGGVGVDVFVQWCVGCVGCVHAVVAVCSVFSLWCTVICMGVCAQSSVP